MTTQLEQAARLALEALEYRDGNGADQWKADVIISLRAALSDAALERMADNARELGLEYEQPAQDKPVECMCGICKLGKREPLTNEEIGKAAREAHIAFCLDKHQTYEHAFTRAIEQAHGIKGEK